MTRMPYNFQWSPRVVGLRVSVLHDMEKQAKGLGRLIGGRARRNYESVMTCSHNLFNDFG